MRIPLSFALVVFYVAAGCGDGRKPAAPGSTSTPDKASANDTDENAAKNGRPAEPSGANRPVDSSIPRIEPSPAEPPPAGSQLAEWVAQLASPSDETREQAEQSLITAGSTAIPVLLAGLKNDSPETRRAVAYFLLEKFPSSDGRIVAALRDALSDDDRKVRQLALQAVKRMTPEAMALAAPKIAGLLDPAREEPVNRADAARLLGRMGSEAREALPALVQAARSDPSEKVRAPALYSITRIAVPDQAAPLLVSSLKSDKDATVRLVAAIGLGRLGDSASPAASDLAAVLDDSDEKVRRAASDTLAGLESAAVAPLVARLTAENPRTRELALFTLGRLGPVAKSAVSDIQKCAQDENAAVRAMAEKVLESLGGL
jgi:HEAT repeat protein